jgi:hypothetical protein
LIRSGTSTADDLKDSDMIACVFAANQISKKLEFGFGGNPHIEELPPCWPNAWAARWTK